MGNDITDLKRAQEALHRSNQDLDRFAAVASHDLQEPLRQITACAQLLTAEHSGEFKTDATVLLQFIEQGCRRMHSLVKDLLRLARPSGFVISERVPLAELVRECVAELQEDLTKADGKILTGELPDVLAPRSLIAQIFQNLLSNAIKYHAEGRPLEIVVGAEAGPSEWTFCISDNGRGIPPEHREHIFQWLARAPEAGVSGSGIGLANVKRAVSQIGGRIWVESEMGRGSQFYFTLPLQTETIG
jgi:signal transduction histidine kinase